MNFLAHPIQAQIVKNPPAMQETWVQSLGGEDLLDEGMATLSSILAWRIPWTIWGRKEFIRLSNFHFISLLFFRRELGELD